MAKLKVPALLKLMVPKSAVLVGSSPFSSVRVVLSPFSGITAPSGLFASGTIVKLKVLVSTVGP